VGSDQAAGKWAGGALTKLQASGLAESITKKERGRTASTLHTHHQGSLMVHCPTQHLSHPWGCALGQPTRPASALVREGGTCHLV